MSVGRLVTQSRTELATFHFKFKYKFFYYMNEVSETSKGGVKDDDIDY